MTDSSAEQHIAQLSEQGYTVLRGALEPGLVAGALAEIHTLTADPESDMETARKAFDLGKDLLLWNIHAQDFIFLQTIFSSATLLDILRHFLNDPWYAEIPQSEPNFILHSTIARSSGETALRMHVDSLMVFPGPDTNAISVLFCLEDADAENGATRVVPGSHRAGRYARPEDEVDAITLEAQAGDVVLFDSRLWHGAGANTSTRSRWMLVATFVRWWMKQAFDITGTLPAAHYARLTPTERAVMGYCSIPPRDEQDRYGTRQGLGDLADDVSAYRRGG